MKLVSNLLEGMVGIHIYYVIGLLIFFTLFIVIVVRTMRRPAAEMNEIKESILIESRSRMPRSSDARVSEHKRDNKWIDDASQQSCEESQSDSEESKPS